MPFIIKNIIILKKVGEKKELLKDIVDISAPEKKAEI